LTGGGDGVHGAEQFCLTMVSPSWAGLSGGTGSLGADWVWRETSAMEAASPAWRWQPAGLLGLLVDTAVDMVGGGAHGGGACGERADGVATVPMMLPRLLCICCMARASEPIWSEEWMSSSSPVRSPEAMASAASATRSDAAGDAPGEEKREDAAASAPKMVAVHRVMRTAKLSCCSVAISVSH